MMAQAAGRDAIKAGDINTAADDGVTPDEGAAAPDVAQSQTRDLAPAAVSS